MIYKRYIQCIDMLNLFILSRKFVPSIDTMHRNVQSSHSFQDIVPSHDSWASLTAYLLALYDMHMVTWPKHTARPLRSVTSSPHSLKKKEEKEHWNRTFLKKKQDLVRVIFHPLLVLIPPYTLLPLPPTVCCFLHDPKHTRD